ncbi:hypothetical protein Vafri_18751, partial [Volvox africanus]
MPRSSRRDDDEGEEGGDIFTSILFGNINEDGRADADYLDEDARQSLTILRSKLGKDEGDITKGLTKEVEEDGSGDAGSAAAAAAIVPVAGALNYDCETDEADDYDTPAAVNGPGGTAPGPPQLLHLPGLQFYIQQQQLQEAAGMVPGIAGGAGAAAVASVAGGDDDYDAPVTGTIAAVSAPPSSRLPTTGRPLGQGFPVAPGEPPPLAPGPSPFFTAGPFASGPMAPGAPAQAQVEPGLAAHPGAPGAAFRPPDGAPAAATSLMSPGLPAAGTRAAMAPGLMAPSGPTISVPWAAAGQNAPGVGGGGGGAAAAAAAAAAGMEGERGPAAATLGDAAAEVSEQPADAAVDAKTQLESRQDALGLQILAVLPSGERVIRHTALDIFNSERHSRDMRLEAAEYGATVAAARERQRRAQKQHAARLALEQSRRERLATAAAAE